jgi:SAM-dependent methyltransferase
MGEPADSQGGAAEAGVPPSGTGRVGGGSAAAVARAGPLNTLAGHYAAYFASDRELEWYRVSAVDKARNIMEICAGVPHESVLDIGAGDGAVLHRLDEAGFGRRLCAVEISSSGLAALAAKRWTRLVESREFDGYHVPYADGAFDLAILSHVVEHVEHPRLLLREAARVARRIYIEVPLEHFRLNRRLCGDFVLDSTGHINFFDAGLFRFLVQSSGLRVLRQEVRHTSAAPYRFAQGRRGLVKYAIKEGALRLAPRLAPKYFMYHGAILCEPAASTEAASA